MISMQDQERPLPRIQKHQLYDEIEQLAPHSPGHRYEVHRQRKYCYANVEDNAPIADYHAAGEIMEDENAEGLQPLLLAVQARKFTTFLRPKRAKAKALPSFSSAELKQVVEEDLDAEVHRKREQCRYVSSVMATTHHHRARMHRSCTGWHQKTGKRYEEVDACIEKVAERVSLAEERRSVLAAAREQAEREAQAERERKERMQKMAESLQMHGALKICQSVAEEPEAGHEESEEQRILREFTEYEMESPSHGGNPESREAALKDMLSLDGCDNPDLSSRPEDREEPEFEEEDAQVDMGAAKSEFWQDQATPEAFSQRVSSSAVENLLVAALAPDSLETSGDPLLDSPLCHVNLASKVSPAQQDRYAEEFELD